jgi:hydrogenase nickel incorporation protein HypB
MCSTCGCGGPEGEAKILKPGEHNHSHDHHHGHDHLHSHDHHHTKSILEIEQDILNANNLAAERNRGYFEALNITALNLVSSPGSGKTTLLETTIKDLGSELPIAVIEGDQQTTNDADRIAELNIPVRQINTGKGCHLDGERIRRAYQDLKPAQNSLLMIENVGNLVCPALFDLGEQYRIVIISTTEGDDKPLKYPDMFAHSHICIINKIDLLPYVQFDTNQLKSNALRINPSLSFFEVSATTGEGMTQWFNWLKENISTHKTS